jgi:membrane protein required for colicin V production
VTLFDIIALLILGVSGLVGLVRGALREVSTAVAFVLAVVVALVSLRFTARLARAAVHPSWAANSVALILVFLAVYVLARVIAGAMGRGVHATQVLGTADRLIGGAIGLVRGLIVLGLFNLLFHAATPPEQAPAWITEAKLYPLSQVAARALRVLAPKALSVAHGLSPSIARAVKGDAADSSQHSDSGQSRESGYGARERKGLGDQVDNPR